MTYQVDAKFKAEALQILEAYPHKRAALLPLLWLVQEQEGYISLAAMETIASYLELPAAEVLGVVSFYTMFQQEPLGKYHLKVCGSLCCQLKGADWLLKYLEKKLAIAVGQTTPDGLIHLSTVQCLGSCGTAPMMQINHEYYENLDEQKVDTILAGLST